MRGPLKAVRALRLAHAWCGVFVALLLALIGLTGAACALESQLLQLTLPAARAPAPPAGTLGPALARYQAENPPRIVFAAFSIRDRGVHRLFLENAGDAFIDGHGRVVERPAGRPRIEDYLASLHYTLLAGEPGEFAVGLIGVTGILMTVSGLIVWSTGRPRLARLPRSMRRPELLAAHRDWAALLALLFLFQMATGASMAFREPIGRLFGGGPAPPDPPRSAAAGPPDWRAIMATAQARFPDGQIRQLSAPDRAAAPFEIRIRRPGELSPSGETIAYIASDGAFLGARDGRSEPTSERLMNSLLGLHSGQLLGRAAQPVLFLTGTGLAVVSLLGGWAFLRRTRRS